MQQMQKLFGNPEDLSVDEMFKKYKLCQNVPYWQDNPAARQWMSERRACPETQRHLPVIENSVECVGSLEAQAGVKVRSIRRSCITAFLFSSCNIKGTPCCAAL